MIVSLRIFQPFHTISPLSFASFQGGIHVQTSQEMILPYTENVERCRIV